MLTAVAVATSCSSEQKTSTGAAAPRPSTSNPTAPMVPMAGILSQLMPKLTEQTSNPAKLKEILDLSKALKEQAHGVDFSNSSASPDPALRFVSRNLNNEVASAVTAMESGDWSKGRRQMTRVTRNCIACHTMKASTSRDITLTPNLSGFSESEKGDYFASVRNFDQAIIHYETQLSNSAWAQANPEQWNFILQKLLAVSIRVYNRAGLTMELVSRFQDIKSYPANQKEMTKIWREHTKEWRNEGAEPKDKKAKALELYNRASALPKKEKGRSAAAIPSRENLVLLLRASGLMHEYLNEKKNARDQEALYLAGQIAEGLAATNFWTYPEDYYLACISANSNSPWAKKCGEKFNRITSVN